MRLSNTNTEHSCNKHEYLKFRPKAYCHYFLFFYYSPPIFFPYPRPFGFVTVKPLRQQLVYFFFSERILRLYKVECLFTAQRRLHLTSIITDGWRFNFLRIKNISHFTSTYTTYILWVRLQLEYSEFSLKSDRTSISFVNSLLNNSMRKWSVCRNR